MVPVRDAARERSDAPASPTTARATPGTPASPTAASSGPGTPGSSSRTWRPTSSPCGTCSRPTRRSAASTPTTPTVWRFAGGLPPAFEAKGYTYVDPGRFEDGTEDYTAIISQFRKDGVEIVNGVPDAARLRQLLEAGRAAGLPAEDVHQAKAMLFPDGVNALGDLGDGQTVECWFHPEVPVHERAHRADALSRSATSGKRKRTRSGPSRSASSVSSRSGPTSCSGARTRWTRTRSSSHQADQDHHHRRPGRLDRQPRPVLRLLQLLHQADQRRPVGQGRRQVAVRPEHRGQRHPAGRSRRPRQIKELVYPS